MEIEFAPFLTATRRNPDWNLRQDANFERDHAKGLHNELLALERDFGRHRRRKFLLASGQAFTCVAVKRPRHEQAETPSTTIAEGFSCGDGAGLQHGYSE
jgi:hypothetical protein